jgi:hypothetical protein
MLLHLRLPEASHGLARVAALMPETKGRVGKFGCAIQDATGEATLSRITLNAIDRCLALEVSN